MKQNTKQALWFLVTVAVLCVGPLPGKGVITPVPSGTWVTAGNMSSARSGASVILLRDGRVLIIGGDSGSGVLASVDILTSGNYSAVAPMNFARSKHTATVLPDGRVMVAGGTGASGLATDTAEIYDPVAGTWTVTGFLMCARSTHTASFLPDGTVLLAGGIAQVQLSAPWKSMIPSRVPSTLP